MLDRPNLEVSLNNTTFRVADGTMASAVYLNNGAPFRVSVSGDPRSAVCGMGICFECRAIVDGVPHRRTCQIVCCDGMRLETQR